MKENFWLIFIAALVLSIAITIGCGDDDDDDDDDNDDDTDYPTVGEDGFGTPGGGAVGSGYCDEDKCLAMLNFMNECGFPCQDYDGNQVDCTKLKDYCVECQGFWSCDLYCYEIEQDSCYGFMDCGIYCENQ